MTSESPRPPSAALQVASLGHAALLQCDLADRDGLRSGVSGRCRQRLHTCAGQRAASRWRLAVGSAELWRNRRVRSRRPALPGVGAHASARRRRTPQVATQVLHGPRRPGATHVLGARSRRAGARPRRSPGRRSTRRRAGLRRADGHLLGAQSQALRDVLRRRHLAHVRKGRVPRRRRQSPLRSTGQHVRAFRGTTLGPVDDSTPAAERWRHAQRRASDRPIRGCANTRRSAQANSSTETRYSQARAAFADRRPAWKRYRARTSAARPA
jgi:hypothetical protein